MTQARVRPVQRLDATVYLAPPDHVERVVAELDDVREVRERLVVAGGPPQPSVWAQDVWLEPFRLTVRSVADAARQLRAIQRNWWPHATGSLHRRAELVRQALPHVSAKPLRFPEPPPTAPLGAFTLLAPDTVLASARTSSPFPDGEPRFVEYREDEGPPSRAYLKLFEALTVLGERPRPGDRCLDLGASPGGWTWVLATLGAEVLAWDRAPLAPAVARLPGVTARQGDAFAATPEAVGRIDWLFSDVICFPERLLAHVRRWLDSGLCGQFVTTVKFQGAGHYGVIPAFAGLAGGRLVHLAHNKHELTWMRVDRGPSR